MFKIAIFAAVLAVVACDLPAYGKAPAVYKRPAYKPAYAPAPYHPAPYAAASAYEPAYVPAPSAYKPAYKPAYGKSYSDDYYDHPQYNFLWAVKDDYSGNDYNHAEYRNGDDTKGEYRTLLPDGRLQIVTYTADEYGYNAVVNYEGHAHYDYKPAASYAPRVYAPAPYKPAYRPAYPAYPAPYPY